MSKRNLIQETAMALPSEKREKFLRFSSSIQMKTTMVAILLLLFTGGLGGHHFYLGNTKRAWVSVFFFWTLIPAILCWIDIFFVAGQVRELNQTEIDGVLEMMND